MLLCCCADNQGRQGRRHVFQFGGVGLCEKALSIKKARINPSKNKKLIGSRPLFLGKGPFYEPKLIEMPFQLSFSPRLGVQLHPLHPRGAILEGRRHKVLSGGDGNVVNQNYVPLKYICSTDLGHLIF